MKLHSSEKKYGILLFSTILTVVLAAIFCNEQPQQILSVTSGNTIGVVNTAPAITTQPQSQTVIVGQPVSFSVVATGSPAPSYQWKKNGVTISGANSSVYTIANAQIANAGYYTVRINNVAGSITSNKAYLTVYSVPVISVQPISQSVTAGRSITLRVRASATPAPTYQWMKNGTAISGATSSVFYIPSTVAGDSGNYAAVVSNTAGTVTSNSAYLTIYTVPVITVQPVSQTATIGQNVTFSVTASGNPAPTCKWKKNGVIISGATSAVYSISSVVMADSGSYAVDAANSQGSATSNAAHLTVTAALSAPVIAFQPASQTVTAGQSVTFSVTVTGNPLPTYQWKKNGATISGATSATFSIASAGPADSGSYAVVVANSQGSVTSNAAQLTVSAALSAPVIAVQPASQAVAVGQNITFNVTASGNPAPTYQWKKNGMIISGATSAAYSISSVVMADSGSYTVDAANSQGSATSNAAHLTVTAALSAPVIAFQPASQTVTAGQSVTFSVTATGNPLPTYQWKKNSATISGATSATFSIASAGPADSGSYAVVVANSQGSVTSNAAQLTVSAALSAPIISVQPVSRTATVGQSVTFNVVATGNPAPSYQWAKNGTTIPGAIADTYSISSVQTADAGNYSVTVGNTQGSATSNQAILTVASGTVITPNLMISIPGGTFLMGCEQLEATPIHSVTLSAFKISNTHVTQGEFQRVMGKNPSNFSGETSLPVESVSWFDAVLYCNQRSKMEQKDTVYSFDAVSGTPGNGASGLSNLQIDFTKNGYRLPTEAEWEYACRAGTTTDYYWGGSYPPHSTADTMSINNNAVWYPNSGDHTLPVGGKQPNAWGLYDMVGNVWQWLNDWNGKYSPDAQTDPTGPAVSGSDLQRIARGSSWSMYDSDYLLRSAVRNGGWHPEDRSSLIGFRVVCRP